MEIALPGLKNQFDLPAQRVHFYDGFRLPYAGRDIGNNEVPGHQRQVGLRRRVAFLLRVLPGDYSACIDDRLGHTHGNETRGDALCGPDEESFLEEQDVALDSREALRQLHRAHTTSNRFIHVGLMIEATAKIRTSRRHAGEGFDLKIASIKEEQYAFLRQSDDLIDIALIGNVPGCQRKMTTKTAFIPTLSSR